MKEYCTDLEIAKELEKNKFPYKSSFEYQVTQFTGDGEYVDIVYNGNGIITPTSDCTYTVYAQTSDEILKELPPIFGPYQLTIAKCFIYYQVSYKDDNDGEIMNDSALFDDKKLSNALAKLWLYLKKEGYIK